MLSWLLGNVQSLNRLFGCQLVRLDFPWDPMMVQIMIAFALMHINAPTIQVGILGVDLLV